MGSNRDILFAARRLGILSFVSIPQTGFEPARLAVDAEVREAFPGMLAYMAGGVFDEWTWELDRVSQAVRLFLHEDCDGAYRLTFRGCDRSGVPIRCGQDGILLSPNALGDLGTMLCYAHALLSDADRCATVLAILGDRREGGIL
jgi:hypothetical protein